MSQHGRSLPPSANLQQLRNQAKDLSKAHSRGSADALTRIKGHHPRYHGASGADVAAGCFSLADAQLVVARELGFASWPKLKTHIENDSQRRLSMHCAVKVAQCIATFKMDLPRLHAWTMKLLSQMEASQFPTSILINQAVTAHRLGQQRGYGFWLPHDCDRRQEEGT